MERPVDAAGVVETHTQAARAYRQLIDEFCGGMLPGHEFYAYLPGGASGGILPASLGDVPLDFFMGGGGALLIGKPEVSTAATPASAAAC